MPNLTENQITNIVEDYLKSCGYSLQRIPEGGDKTPDFEIAKQENEYVAELKSPELLMDDITQLFKFKTTHSKLLTFIRKARKQFISFDSEHKKPRVLIFTSSHFQLNWKSLTDAMQGGVVVQGGQASPDFTKTEAFKKAATEMYDIDLYIWLQLNAEQKKAYQLTILANQKTKHKTLTTKIVEDLHAHKLSTMDNFVVLA
jgi:hypothetical protein